MLLTALGYRLEPMTQQSGISRQSGTRSAPSIRIIAILTGSMILAATIWMTLMFIVANGF